MKAAKPRVRKDQPIAPETQPRLFIRVSLDGGHIGPGKVALLEQIDKLGSIAAAGKQLRMSYKRAWYLLDEINDLCREPVVSKMHGGRSGGGSTLTGSGHALVALYRKIHQQATKAASAQILELTKLGR